MRQSIINNEEAKTCTRKYFKANSLVEEFFCSIIRGTKESILSSRPIQAPSQEDDETAKIDLEKMRVINKMFKLFKINKV